MADIITGTTTGVVDTSTLQGEHADIRREAAEHRASVLLETTKGFDRVNADVLRGTNETVKEGLKEAFNIRGDVKDARYDVSDRIGNSADRIVDRLTEHDAKVADRFFAVGRDTQDIRAQIVAQQQQMVAGFLGVSKDTEIAALKTQMEIAKQTTYLSDKIDNQAEKTRELLNDLKYHDLNRGLVERNTELVNCEQDRRRHYDRWLDGRFDMNQAQFAGQWAQLQSQIQAFQSQLQETRQGMVNFGTMAGVGQSSTSNNVR
jgi:hypothetical protein